MATSKPSSGPTLEQYVETRFNLLVAAMDKTETALLERIAAHGHLDDQVHAGIGEKFQHIEQLFALTQATSTRAVDKAEATQHQHNVASNEWRGTLNDFKSTMTSKQEFDRLAADFAAYKLEQSRLQLAGQKENTKESKEDSKSMWSMAIAVASALFVVWSTFNKHDPAPVAPQIIVVPAGTAVPNGQPAK